MENNFIIIALVILFVAYIVYTKLVGSKGTDRKSRETAIYKYKSKDYIMTQSEVEFFKILINVAGDRYFAFPQVHLSAILDHKVPGQDWKPAFRHINGKSVDFVLCDKVTLKAVYAIELDDTSHESTVRQERDGEVERIFQDTDLPLVRFSNYKSLSQDEIAQRFYEAHSLHAQAF